MKWTDSIDTHRRGNQTGKNYNANKRYTHSPNDETDDAHPSKKQTCAMVAAKVCFVFNQATCAHRVQVYTGNAVRFSIPQQFCAECNTKQND